VQKRQAFVYGTDVAGLACAELLVRNGWGVTLLQPTPRIDPSRVASAWLRTAWRIDGVDEAVAHREANRVLRSAKQIYGHVFATAVNLKLRPGRIEHEPQTRGWFEPLEVTYVRPNGLRHSFERISDLALRVEDVRRGLIAALGAARYVDASRYRLHYDERQTSILIGGERHSPELLVLTEASALQRQLRQLGGGRHGHLFQNEQGTVCSTKPLALPRLVCFDEDGRAVLVHVVQPATKSGEQSTLFAPTSSVSDTADQPTLLRALHAQLGLETNLEATSTTLPLVDVRLRAWPRQRRIVGKVNRNTIWATVPHVAVFPVLIERLAKFLQLRTDLGGPIAFLRAGGELRPTIKGR
jgi:hypothetical protein